MADSGISREGTLGLLYYSSILYVCEVIAAMDCDGDGAGPSREEIQSASPCRRRAAPAKATVLISECVHSASSVISVFSSLDHQHIRRMPALFLVRVLHAMIFLVKSSCDTGLDQIPVCKSSNGEDAKVERQLDDMMEIMASWGSDWPASKLIQICISLRRQLRNKSDKPKVVCGSSPCSLCTSYEDRDTEPASSNFPEPPSPAPYPRFAQEAFSFKEAVSPPSNGTSYADSSFWDDFLEQVPAPRRSVSPLFSHSNIWKAQQPQQYTFLSGADISSEWITPTGLSWDNNEYE